MVQQNLKNNEKNDDKMTDVIKDVSVNEEDLEDEEGPPSFEKVLECLGIGRYQIIQMALPRLTILTTSFMVLSIVFVGYTPYHECKKVNETELVSKYIYDSNKNTTSAQVSYESCDIKITISSNQSNTIGKDKSRTTIHSLSCPNGRDFFSAKGTTYTSEWDLVCESKGQADFSHAIYTIGQIFGGLISSPISDRFGRKPVFVTALCLCFFVEILHVLAPNIFIIYIIRFASGMVCIAAVISAMILSIELAVPRHRQIVGVAYYVGGVITACFVGVVAYFVQDLKWQYYHYVSIGTGLMAFTTPFILKESPRWLTANGRHEEALKILKFACKQNGKDFEIVKKKFAAYIAYEYPSSNQSAQPLIKDNTISDAKGTCNKKWLFI